MQCRLTYLNSTLILVITFVLCVALNRRSFRIGCIWFLVTNLVNLPIVPVLCDTTITVLLPFLLIFCEGGTADAIPRGNPLGILLVSGGRHSFFLFLQRTLPPRRTWLQALRTVPAVASIFFYYIAGDAHTTTARVRAALPYPATQHRPDCCLIARLPHSTRAFCYFAVSISPLPFSRRAAYRTACATPDTLQRSFIMTVLHAFAGWFCGPCVYPFYADAFVAAACCWWALVFRPIPIGVGAEQQLFEHSSIMNACCFATTMANAPDPEQPRIDYSPAGNLLTANTTRTALPTTATRTRTFVYAVTDEPWLFNAAHCLCRAARLLARWKLWCPLTVVDRGSFCRPPILDAMLNDRPPTRNSPTPHPTPPPHPPPPPPPPLPLPPVHAGRPCLPSGPFLPPDGVFAGG